MKKSEILKIAQSNAERISAIERHLGIGHPKEPEKLDVGKWYLFTGHEVRFKPLMFVTGIREVGIVEFSGFNFQGKWTDSDNYSLDDLSKGYREATPQEVKEALIAEAKKRYNVGDKLSKVCDDFSRGPSIFSLNLEHQAGLCDLWIKKDGGTNYDSCIFKNGKWATIIEQDKFAELKEAHKNGAVIQAKNKLYGMWTTLDRNHIQWDGDVEYRIKPEDKPKVGDIVKVWDAKEGKSFIGTLHKKCTYGVPYPFVVKLYNSRDDYNFYGNAEKITRTEAIELLFGKEVSNER